MQKLIHWYKKNWLMLSGCFLLFFIPLYPKLPLFDIVQTWVYIRLEDLLVAILFAFFVLMLWRRKLFPSTPLTWPIVLYWGVGLISLIIAIFYTSTVTMDFRPHLGVLHFLRRIEYMMLFFVGYYAIHKNPRALPYIIWTLVITTILIIIYGVGQKFLGYPAFLTMNEEFAKGIPLRLPPTARIPSTFGGHYDLAAYLAMVIPIFGSLVFSSARFWQKIIFFMTAVGSLILLLFTASRISFGVYLIAITIMLIWQKKKWLIIPVIVVSFLLLNSVSTASDRFYKTLRFSDVVIDLSTGQPIGTLAQLEGGTATLEKQENPGEETLPKGSEFIGVPQNNTTSKSFKTIEMYTSDALATGSGEIATVSGSFLVQKAFVYDISLTTRFGGQWPKAMAAFRANPLLGSGFSSLSVASDGDYLRMLGETGVIGSASFLGILVMIFALFFRGRNNLTKTNNAFVTGLSAGLVGLLVNALLIDVFEASKVAFPFWMLVGVSVALLSATQASKISYASVLWRVVSSRLSLIVLLFSSVFLYYGKVLMLYFTGTDFSWLRGAASATFSDLTKFQSLTKIMYFFLYTFFWLKPWGYHVVSLMLFSTIAVCLFLILEKRGIRKYLAVIISLLFIFLSVNAESVFWISAMGSLLSAYLIVLAIVCLLYGKKYFIPAILCILGAVYTHEFQFLLLLSVLLLWLLGELLEFIWKKNIVFLRIATFAALIIISYLNIRSFVKITQDWQRASFITESAMLALKKNYFPLQDKQAFVFVNTPRKFGNAWIFQNGLEDALWHMFKFNPYPYQVFSATTLEDGFKITSPLGEPIVLVFEDYVLKRAAHIIKTIEEENP